MSVSLSVWKQVQAVTGLAIGSFSTLHIANQLFAIQSQDAYDGVMLMLREVYQRPVVELAGLATVMLHVFSGIKIANSQPRVTDARRTLHHTTGYALAGMFGLHVLHMRVWPALHSTTADFSYVHHFLYNYPAITVPAFNVLLFAGIYHTTYGIARALSNLGILKVKQAIVDATIVSAATAGVIAIQGLAGKLYFVLPTTWASINASARSSMGSVSESFGSSVFR